MNQQSHTFLEYLRIWRNFMFGKHPRNWLQMKGVPNQNPLPNCASVPSLNNNFGGTFLLLPFLLLMDKNPALGCVKNHGQYWDKLILFSFAVRSYANFLCFSRKLHGEWLITPNQWWYPQVKFMNAIWKWFGWYIAIFKKLHGKLNFSLQLSCLQAKALHSAEHCQCSCSQHH